MTRSVIRADIAEEIYKQVGLSRNESLKIVSTILDEINSALEHDEKVKISSFGTFQVNHKRERIGRNPKTGEEVPITPRRVVTFRASQMMRDRVESSPKV